MLGPYTRISAPTARRQRTPTARPEGEQPGEGKRLNSDAPHNSERHPPPGRPFRHPHSAQRRLARAHAVGPVPGSPRPHQPHPGHTGRRTPAARPRGRAAGGGTAPDTRRPSQQWEVTPPRGRPPPPLRHAAPHRACKPRGHCWAPTPAHVRPQHVGSGPRRLARRAGSRGRASA